MAYIAHIIRLRKYVITSKYNKSLGPSYLMSVFMTDLMTVLIQDRLQDRQ